MVQERIEIVVTDRGTRRVRRNIASIGATANSAATGVNFLRNGLIALGAGLTIRGLLRTADAFTQIQNSLRLVTEGTQQLGTVTNELLAISNRTRTSLQTNADFFRRLTLATRELGVEQAQLLQITESINQAIQVSGASTKEAQNGLIQLSQGLSSGGLRGDELRSVLEQLPRVADVIANQLGVTRGELRALGAEFRITSDVIIDGFAKAAKQLEAEFGEVVPTIDQSLVVLNNSFTVTFGRLNEGLGVTRLLSQAILGLALNLETLVNTVLTASAAFAGFKIGSFLQNTVNARIAQRELNAAIAAGNAIRLGSAQAEAAQAAFAAANLLETQRGTAATVAAAKAELVRARTLSLQGGTMAAVTAAETALTAAETAHTQATTALTAAQGRYTAALKASSTQQTLFQSIISGTTARVKQLTVALLSNPFTAIVTALTTVTALLFTFRNDIRFGTDQVATLGNVASVVWNDIKRGVGLALGAFGELVSFLTGLNPFENLKFSFEDVLRVIALGLDILIGQFIGVRRFLEQIASSIGVTFRSLGVTLKFFFENISRAAEAAFSGNFIDASQFTEDAFSNLTSGIKSSFNALGTGAGEAFADGVNKSRFFETLLDDVISDAEKLRLRELQEAGKGAGGGGGVDEERLGAVEVLIEKIQEEARLLALNNQQREVETRLVREIEQLRSQGVQVSEEQTEAVREQLALLQAAAQQAAFTSAVDSLREQQILLQQSNEEQELNNQLIQLRNQIAGEGGTLTEAQEEELRLLVETNLALERQSQILQELNGPIEAYETGLRDLQELLDQGRISQQQFNQSVRDLKIAALDSSTEVGDGFTRGLLKAQAGLEDFAGTAENTVVNAFNAAEDALVQFARTGELNFDQLVNTILDGLARLAAQQLLLSLLGGPGATQSGGLLSGLFGQAASGGSVSSNMPQLVGEKGPELFLPPGAGQIVPASQTADIMAGQPTVVPPPEVSVNVVNVQSDDDVVDAIGGRNGEQAILNVIRRNRRTIRNDLS